MARQKQRLSTKAAESESEVVGHAVAGIQGAQVMGTPRVQSERSVGRSCIFLVVG